MLNKNSHTLGQAAEDAACHHLLKHGLKLLRRNYRCRMGEIDLVMLDRGVMIFVEVRYRKASRFGNGLETVGASKRHKLYKTAQHYLLYHPQYQNFVCRFDVVAITLLSKQQIELTWVQNAFHVLGV